MQKLSRLSSYLYGALSDLKNSAYEKKWISPHCVNAKVISIGNLTVGGTGKTPVCQFLIEHLRHLSKKTIVVSRSYKATLNHPEKVDITRPRFSDYYGDEVSMLASLNPDVLFYSGPVKWKTAQYADNIENPDVIIVDDGFQHRHLCRNLDILLLDATDDFNQYELLPVGRAREKWENIHRADFVIITKVNMVPLDKLKELEKRIPLNIPRLKMSYDFPVPEIIKKQKILAISGIAKPGIWIQMLQKHNPMGMTVLSYEDHFRYDTDTIDKIEREFISNQCDVVYTTEKDYVKLKDIWPEEIPIVVTRLKLEPLSDVEFLYRKMDEIFN